MDNSFARIDWYYITNPSKSSTVSSARFDQSAPSTASRSHSENRHPPITGLFCPSKYQKNPIDNLDEPQPHSSADLLRAPANPQNQLDTLNDSHPHATAPGHSHQSNPSSPKKTHSRNRHNPLSGSFRLSAGYPNTPNVLDDPRSHEAPPSCPIKIYLTDFDHPELSFDISDDVDISASESLNFNLAGNKRRSFSGQGGLLNRMFGNSGSTNNDDGQTTPTSPNSSSKPNLSVASSVPDGPVDPADPKSPDSPIERRSDDISPNGEKRSRRTSGIGKARDMFTSAKNSLHQLSSSPTRSSPDKLPQTPIQKLGKTDPALSVPQGPLNNAAGESNPGPRSTFQVGVTEDKNKKCRRTMEDTHAYLYNFLSTPAPALNADAATRDRASTQDSQNSQNSLPVVETDNGYFAIFDGHAGTFAAEWCGKKLHILLEETIRKNPNKPIPELLDETFTIVDQHLEKLPLKNSGCTAVTAVLRWEDRIPHSNSATGSMSIAPAAAAVVARDPSHASSHDGGSQETANQQPSSTSHPAESKLREAATRQRVLYTANVGDARIVLCRNGKALRLSYDHKGSDDNEGKRIANAGGLILNNRVNGVLAVTRALGDAYMKDLVTGHPYTTETVIQPDIDEFLILACDGVSASKPRPEPFYPFPRSPLCIRTHCVSNLSSFCSALGRLHRPGGCRPGPKPARRTSCQQGACGPRTVSLLYGQSLMYDCSLQQSCFGKHR